MSRLDHPELHLTFRDWSSSESEEENYNNMSDNDNNNNNNPNAGIDINFDINLYNTANAFNRRAMLDSYNQESNNNNNNNNNINDTGSESDSENLNSNNNNRTYTPPGSNELSHISSIYSNNNHHDGEEEDDDDDKDDEISYDNLFSIRNTPLTLFDNVLNDETDYTTYYNRDTNNNTSNNNSIENSPQDIRSIDNSNSSTPPHLLNGINLSDLQNINWIPSILNNDYTMKRNSSFSNFSFFKFHPQHEMNYNIPNLMQKYGLINMMNELLIFRNNSLLLSNKSNNNNNNININKKRNFNQFYFEDMNLLFLLDSNNSKLQQISKSSFLKTGLIYNLPIPLNNLNCCLKFTDINFNNLNVSGLFQFGDIQLNFNGEIVDFLKSDLRFTKDRKFLIEGNIFSNLLRNKLIFSRKFNKLFDYKRKKNYKKKTWKPFSMNKMGYIISNKDSFKTNQYINNNNNNNNNKFESFFNFNKTLINPIKSAKFPNGSLFHKLQVTNESKFDSFKLLSKWFEMPPLNQFINTPSPPTPPNRLNKCTNNPENLLVCKDCVNLMISKFIFLKIEIDIHDLIDNKNLNSLNKVYPDLVYKHRRRFHDYANKLMSKSNNNFRKHLERQMREMPNTSIPIFGNMLLRYSSDEDSDNDNEIILNHENNFVNQSICEEDEIINDIDEYFNFQDTIDIFDNDKDDLMSTDDDDDDDDKNEIDEANNDNDFTDDDMDNTFSDEGPSNYSSNSRLLESSWPLSSERFDESHPILDPNISSTEGSEDDDYDNPYNIIFTNDRSRRVSRLLFNINMSNEQHRHKRSPVSSLNLYKNGTSRLKMIMLLCINRNTGELHMIPGNMDVNLWSTEQNNGELFEDIETFNKVFKFFMEMDNENESESESENKNVKDNKTKSKKKNKDSKYTRKLKKWMRENRGEEIEEVKKLMILQMLTNPSIINGFNKRRETQKEKMEKDKGKKEQSKYNNFDKRVKKSTLKKKKKDNLKKKGSFRNDNYVSEYNVMDNKDQCNNDIREHILALMGENFRFDIDNDKVLTFRSEQGNTEISNKQGNGTSFSFEFA